MSFYNVDTTLINNTPVGQSETTVTTFSGSTGTLTANVLAGGLVSVVTTSAITLTTDTGAHLQTQFKPTSVGQSFQCYLSNKPAATITFTGGTGVTVVGNSGSIAGSFTMIFVWNGVISTVPSWTLYF